MLVEAFLEKDADFLWLSGGPNRRGLNFYRLILNFKRRK
jgi:hypothetical protein